MSWLSAFGSLIGVIGGFLTGLLAEPIKARMATKRRQSELRSLLYREIAGVCLGIELTEQRAREHKIPTPLSAEESLQFLAFDVVYEKELSIIAELREALTFKAFRERVRLALADATTQDAAAKAVGPLLDAKHALEGAIDVNLIDNDKFKAAKDHVWRHSLWSTFGGYRGVFKGLPDPADMLEAMQPFEAIVRFNRSNPAESMAKDAKFLLKVWYTIWRRRQANETPEDLLPARSIECTCITGDTRIECHIFGRNRSSLVRGRDCEAGLVPTYSSREASKIFRLAIGFEIEIDDKKIGSGQIRRLPMSLHGDGPVRASSDEGTNR
jgi:hypothetical protein